MRVSIYIHYPIISDDGLLSIFFLWWTHLNVYTQLCNGSLISPLCSGNIFHFFSALNLPSNLLFHHLNVFPISSDVYVHIRYWFRSDSELVDRFNFIATATSCFIDCRHLWAAWTNRINLDLFPIFSRTSTTTIHSSSPAGRKLVYYFSVRRSFMNIIGALICIWMSVFGNLSYTYSSQILQILILNSGNAATQWDYI